MKKWLILVSVCAVTGCNSGWKNNSSGGYYASSGDHHSVQNRYSSHGGAPRHQDDYPATAGSRQTSSVPNTHTTTTRNLEAYVQKVGKRVNQKNKNFKDYDYIVTYESEAKVRKLPGNRIGISKGALNQMKNEQDLERALDKAVGNASVDN